MGSEKLATYGVGVVFSLVKVFDVAADVGSFSFRRLPHNSVDAWTRLWWPWMGPHPDLSTAVCSPDFAKATDDMVTGGLFRLARYVLPLVAWGNPEPIPLSMQLSASVGNGAVDTAPGVPGLFRSCHVQLSCFVGPTDVSLAVSFSI